MISAPSQTSLTANTEITISRSGKSIQNQTAFCGVMGGEYIR